MQLDFGLLPDSSIAQLINQGAILGKAISPSQIQPASLDLSLGDKAYRVCASFLPGKDASLLEKLQQFKLYEIDLTDSALLEVNSVYIVPLQESLDLDFDICALANPKSSIGRLDVFTRLITDYSSNFDEICHGYKGGLFLEIIPRTFPIIVRKGSCLNQLRFRKRAPYLLDADQLNKLQQQVNIIEPKLFEITDLLPLSVDLSGGKDGILAYRAKRHNYAIDIDKIGFYNLHDFWQPLYVAENNKRQLILEPDQFYILSSYEDIAIPLHYAAEMIAFDPLIGEFRAHYAGFFDPGFGSSNHASRAVLEVRSFDVPFILQHKQIIAKLRFEALLREPNIAYGSQKGSHYQAQKLKLSKHFY